MRVVTNPGSNLDEDMTHACDIDLTPQKIIVDGISHDTRNTIDFVQVDGWVKRAIKHPLTQGSTEEQCFESFTRLAQKDNEVLCVMTSRKLSCSYDSAVSAARKLGKSARIEVVDSGVTDVGAGLCTLAATQARKAGLPLAQVASFVRTFAERCVNVVALATLDNLIKGGSASSLQVWVANFLNIRPILSVVDGATTSVGRMSSKANVAEKMDEYLSSRLDSRSAVWLGVAHGNVPEQAKAVAARLQERYRCEYVLVRPLSPSVYLHVGPGALAAFVFPLDKLAFRPTPLR